VSAPCRYASFRKSAPFYDLAEEAFDKCEDVGNVREDVGNVREDVGNVREDVGNVREDIVLIIAVALIFDYTNGFHDAAAV